MKKLHFSKTVWLCLLTVVAVIFNATERINIDIGTFTELVDAVEFQKGEIMTTILALLGVVNRTVTTSPVAVPFTNNFLPTPTLKQTHYPQRLKPLKFLYTENFVKFGGVAIVAYIVYCIIKNLFFLP